MDIIRKIDAGNLSIDDSFTIATSCSKLLSSGNPNDEMTARTIVIHKYFVAFALYFRFVVVLISSILHSRQVSEPVGLFHFEELIS